MICVDLFSGCGGMSLGFQNAGFEIKAAFDNWAPAQEIYRANFSHPIIDMDLYSEDAISEIDKNAPEIIIGGPPCQDFSIAGKRERGKRANLTIRFAEIVSIIKPKWFVMENVYNIERMSVLPEALEIFSRAGYGLTKKVLNASYCGVPQARKRFFLIGKLNACDGFLDNAIEGGLSSHQMTVRDYLGDSLGTDYYYMHPRNYQRRAVFSVDEPSVTIRGVNRPIPNNYQSHPADKSPINENVRALTTKERSYLQTFPEEFQLPGSKTAVEQAIGNAVPVKLAEFIGRLISQYDADA